MNKKRKFTLVLRGGGGRREINVVCPAITPTLTELLVNGTFEGVFTGGVPASWTKVRGTMSESADVHGGSKALQNNNPAGNTGYLVQNTASVPAGSWVRRSFWSKALLGTGLVVLTNATPTDIGPQVAVADAAYANHMDVVYQPASNAISYKLYSDSNASADANSILYDDCSFSRVTDTDVLVGARSIQTGTYTCKPTVVDGTQAGIKILWLDANNYVKMIVDRGTDTAKLFQCVAGVKTILKTGNITYGAEKVLKVTVAADGTIKLYYDGAQVSTDGSITLANFGKAVYGFSTYASNTVGGVVTSASFF